MPKTQEKAAEHSLTSAYSKALTELVNILRPN